MNHLANQDQSSNLHGHYLTGVALFIGISVGVLLLVILCVTLISWAIGKSELVDSQSKALILNSVTILLVSYFAARLMLILPSYAIETNFTVGDVWSISRQLHWPLTFGFFVLFSAASLFRTAHLHFTGATEFHDDLFNIAIATLIEFTFLMMNLALLTRGYLLIARKPLLDKDLTTIDLPEFQDKKGT